MKKNLLIIAGIAIALTACSNDDKKDSKKGFDRTLPKSTALSDQEVNQIKVLIKPIEQMSFEDLVLYSENETSSEKYERTQKLEEKDVAVQKWLENVSKNCQVNPITENETQNPDTDDIVKDKVVTKLEIGSITDLENKEELCGLNISSNTENQVKYTEVDKKSDYMKLKMLITTKSQTESIIKDQDIMNAYKVNKISTTVQSNSNVEMYYSENNKAQSISAKVTGTMTYFKNNSQDKIKIEMNLLSIDDHNQIATHMFIDFSELPTQVVLSVLMDNKNDNPAEYYLNGTQKTEQEIKEIFGDQINLPTVDSTNKLIRL